jgi:molybdopterin molybdotransferase
MIEPRGMISLEEARERILGQVSVLEAEDAPLLTALGQVLARDVPSHLNIPPLDNSAMDGYAVRAVDTSGASTESPRFLRVIGEVAAGAMPSEEVQPGTAVRIMTGAPVPSGADAVVQFEDTDETRRAQPIREIGVMRPADLGQHIRRAGEDIRRGAVVLRAGTSVGPAQVGVMASLGMTTAPVVRRPVVAVLATGDELVEVGRPLGPGQIYNSNLYSLAAQVLRYGGIPKLLGIARDTLSDLSRKVEEGLSADMLITSAGVSVGTYDVVKDVLAQRGEISFWTVRMKPGKPLAFGTFPAEAGKRRVPHLGLPGNPVSSMICFEQFARPAILKMMGYTNFEKPSVRAILEDEVVNRDGRRVFARAVVTKREGRYYASLTGPQGSGILTSMAQANGLAIIPEDVSRAKPGEEVLVELLDGPMAC